MASTWIDFAEIKRQVGIRDVLAHYGFLDGLTEKKPGVLVGPCPIHGGSGKASFHVDTGKNIWNCFSVCKGGGNVLDLVMRVENCSVREAGEKLSQWFSFDRNAKPKESAKVSGKTDVSDAAAAHTEQRVEVINPPLERPLRNLNPKHPYLAERGLTHETIAHFGIGFCSVGLMRGRIAIPIHDEEGQLVAFAGRAVEEQLATEKGKYRLPDGFKKSHVLYNLNRARKVLTTRAQGLVVVEGFLGAMRVSQAGFENVVALMGSTLSEVQEALLVKYTDRLALMFDGDDAGVACLREFYAKLRRTMYLREIRLEDGEQPDTLPEDRIMSLLS